jgi:hypothetical protein
VVGASVTKKPEPRQVVYVDRPAPHKHGKRKKKAHHDNGHHYGHDW